MKNKEEENKLVINTVMQDFSKHGVLESTVNRSDDIIIKLAEAIKEYRMPLSIGRVLKTSNTVMPNTNLPALVFEGEEITIKLKVMPVDKFGNMNASYLPEEEHKALKKKVIDAGREDLIITPEEIEKGKDLAQPKYEEKTE